MPKNPYTGEEISGEVFQFIDSHNDTYNKIMALNRAYAGVDDGLHMNPEVHLLPIIELADPPEMEKFAESFAQLEKEIEQKRNAVKYYETKKDFEKAADENGVLDDCTFEINDEYKKLINDCKKVGVSEEVASNSVMGLIHNANAREEAYNKSRTIGGPDGIIERYAMFSITTANGHKIPNAEQLDAVKKVMEYACKGVFQSENLVNPGEAFVKKEAAARKVKDLGEELDIAKADALGKLPKDEEEYENFKHIIGQYDEIKDFHDQVKEAYSFPKKDRMRERVRTDALGRYAAAKERSDSHWGITKFFASFLPGIFSETAKDMADEKAWRETLINADFTEKELNDACRKNGVAEQPVKKAAVKNGEEIKGLDLSPRLSKDINKNNIEAKAEEKQQGIDPNLEKDKGEKNKGGLQA